MTTHDDSMEYDPGRRRIGVPTDADMRMLVLERLIPRVVDAIVCGLRVEYGTGDRRAEAERISGIADEVREVSEFFRILDAAVSTTP